MMLAKTAQRAKNVLLHLKPLLAMLFTPGRDTGDFPHINLKALNEKIDDSLKPYLEAGLKAVLKSLTRFSVPMCSNSEMRHRISSWHSFKGYLAGFCTYPVALVYSRVHGQYLRIKGDQTSLDDISPPKKG
jgi:hypothetical protein